MEHSDAQRRRELAKIHIAVRALQLGDAAYRALLDRVAGVASARDLDAAGRRAVLTALETLGYPPRVRGDTPATPQARKIVALWGELYRARKVRHGGAKALRHFVHRMTGVDALEWLDAHQANVVIEGLKAWLARGSNVQCPRSDKDGGRARAPGAGGAGRPGAEEERPCLIKKPRGKSPHSV